MIKADKIIKSNRKTLAIQIANDGSLIVRAPFYCSQKRIDNFLNLKESWILPRIEKVRNDNLKYDLENLKSGDTIYFLGELFKIETINCKKAYIKNEILYLPQNNDIKTELIKFYKIQAKMYLKERLKFLAKELNFSFSSFRLSSAKNRWGSCSSKKSINLNWKLMLCPKNVIDYIIIHELTHTKIMNHSKLFYFEVEKNCPNFKFYEKWLNQNGGILNIGR